MKGENIIISNGQLFKFKHIPYFSKSIMEFSLSISSKFKFYLYFNYLIEFIFLSMSTWIKMYCPNLQDPNSESSSYTLSNIPLVQKHRKLLLAVAYNKELVDENGQPLYPTKCNMPSSSCNPAIIIVWYNVISTNQFHCAY